MTSIGIIGASGFTGAELLRLCAGHPSFDVAVATGDSQAGNAIADLYPSLGPVYGDRVFDTFSVDDVAGLDLVFLGLPHGASQAVVPQLQGKVDHIVDLASDFRLTDPELYPIWYGDEHTSPELLADFVYGLPELFRDRLEHAPMIAAPGCNVTTAVLALAPLLAGGLAESSGIIVDAACGVSGAGRPPKPNTTFCTVDEDVTAYGLLDHRHNPEIQQVLADFSGSDVEVLFTPHLVPMNRGILATCYARPTSDQDTEALLAHYREFYAAEEFVTVVSGSPSTKATLGSNSAHVTVRRDPRTGWILAIAAIDNLVKGASGQAIQCANLALGLPEASGLTSLGMYP